MPRIAPRLRKQYVEGMDVLDFETEETLVHGVPLVFGPPPRFRTADDWARDWERWRDVVLPKVIEHRPGTRPFAMYALGEIPRREPRLPLPEWNEWWHIDVRERDGSITTHHLNVPEPWMEPEVSHLRRLGIVDARELRRHHEWLRRLDADRRAADTYPLEVALYE